MFKSFWKKKPDIFDNFAVKSGTMNFKFMLSMGKKLGLTMDQMAEIYMNMNDVTISEFSVALSAQLLKRVQTPKDMENALRFRENYNTIKEIFKNKNENQS